MCSANCVRVSSVNVQHGHGCSARLYISASTKRRLNLAQAVPPLPALSVDQMGFLPQRIFRDLISTGSWGGWIFGFSDCTGPKYPILKNYIASTVLEMEIPKGNGHLKISMRCFIKHWNRSLCTNMGSWPHVWAGVDKEVTAPGLAELKESLDDALRPCCGSWRWSWAGLSDPCGSLPPQPILWSCVSLRITSHFPLTAVCNKGGLQKVTKPTQRVQKPQP